MLHAVMCSAQQPVHTDSTLYAGGSILAAALAGGACTPSTDPDSPPRSTMLMPDLELAHNKPQPLRTMSSPLQAAMVTRASTPVLERATTVKPMSFFCYTPKSARTEFISHAPVPLATPFGRAEPRAISPSLQTAFGMATPLQRALQVALQSSGSAPAMSAFEAASDMSHHTSVPLNVTPVQLPSFDALPCGGHPMQHPVLGEHSYGMMPDSLSHDLEGLSFGMDGTM